MDKVMLKEIVEVLLFSHQGPLSLEKMQSVFDEEDRPSAQELQEVLALLQMAYKDHSFELTQVASGYLIQTKTAFNQWVSRLHSEKPVKYSKALLETLAIIAYKQPVTRADIEDVRGVVVNSQIIKTLIERDWIKIAGYKDVPGKPAVYTTTKAFLNYFNLKHLNELPPLKSITL